SAFWPPLQGSVEPRPAVCFLLQKVARTYLVVEKIDVGQPSLLRLRSDSLEQGGSRRLIPSEHSRCGFMNSCDKYCPFSFFTCIARVDKGAGTLRNLRYLWVIGASAYSSCPYMHFLFYLLAMIFAKDGSPILFF
ncbi:unnamed protein product, partial [Ectocarpus sp. 12 AP-2014]